MARAALAVLLLLCALAGCTVGPSQRPPVAVRGDGAAPAPGPPAPADPGPPVLPEPQPQAPVIPFGDCTAETVGALAVPPDRPLRADCGRLLVPADVDRPELGDAALDVLRVGAADAPPERPPLLVLGDSAGEPSARAALDLATRVAPGLLERYTLVGLDRRGSGGDRLDCATRPARAALVDADPAALDEAALARLLEQARSVVQDCSIAVEELLGTYRTAATTVDVDQLRAALGVERLSAVGTGDGAAALAAWARAAPASVGRLVLDGPPAPDADGTEDGAPAAAEAAFTAFAADCASRPGCPLGADPRAAVTALLGRLREQPLTADDGRRLTAGGATTVLLDAVGDPAGWPALAAALAAAGAGDPAPLLVDRDTLVEGGLDARLATACNDRRARLAPGEVAALAQRWAEAHPLFGAALALRQLSCAPWPTTTSTPPTGTAQEAPPILVIGTAGNPRADLESSRRTADSLLPARFLGWLGAGAGAYPRSSCVQQSVDAVLVDGVPPGTDTVCPP